MVRKRTGERQHAFDAVFLWMTAGFVLFGLLMLASASGPSAYAKFNDSLWFVKHQILFGVLPGSIALILFARMDYHRLRFIATPMLIASFLLLLLVFLPGIGAPWGTSRSWLYFFGFSLQPAEIVKLFFCIFLAVWLDRVGEDGVRDVHRGLLPLLFFTGMIAFLLVLQPDIGGMSIVVGMALLLYFLSGARISHLLAIASVALGAFAFLIYAAPYRAARFMTFLHPETDPRGVGYHINQALLAIGSGGMFGLGYGHSRQKFLYLPEVEGDSIFAILGEELGFLLTVSFLGAILFFLFRGFRIARQAPDRLGRLLASGVMCWLGLQMFVNIAGMLSLMPLTGLTLPFVSYGGTSLFMTLGAAGVVCSVSRARLIR